MSLCLFAKLILPDLVEALNSINFWIISPLSRSAFDFVLKKSPNLGDFSALEIKIQG